MIVGTMSLETIVPLLVHDLSHLKTSYCRSLRLNLLFANVLLEHLPEGVGSAFVGVSNDDITAYQHVADGDASSTSRSIRDEITSQYRVLTDQWIRWRSSRYWEPLNCPPQWRNVHISGAVVA